jgi:hypothetical protein
VTTQPSPTAAERGGMEVMTVEEIDPKVLESLLSKVRIGLLWETSLTIATSPESGRWGKTIKAKFLTSREALALAAILIAANDEAEKNRERKRQLEAACLE